MSAPETASPIGSAAEAAKLIGHLADVMDALLGTIEEETELVRAGRLREAARLEASKTELSRMYLVDTSRIRQNWRYISDAAPEHLGALRQRHNLFEALLQINLTVLATAHAVSEGIMRGVSEELGRRATPQAYGASGHARAPSASSLQPLAVSRVL